MIINDNVAISYCIGRISLLDMQLIVCWGNYYDFSLKLHLMTFGSA